MRYDYTSMGFYTFDCLGWPFTAVPEGGGSYPREELTLVAELCVEHDAIAITDEIYEHITYDGTEHVPIATLPGMAERTITISALSKTYSVTGWRVGWAVAWQPRMAGIRPVHDFMTVAAAAPPGGREVRGVGLSGPPTGQHAIGVVRLDPAFQEAGRHRHVRRAVADPLKIHARKPA